MAETEVCQRLYPLAANMGFSYLCALTLLVTALRCKALFLSPEQLLQEYKRQGLLFREDSILNNGPILDEYDFVVIGSGPAGSVVANRLTENPDWKVLVLEAGIDSSIYNDVPGFAINYLLTEYNWNYPTERQDSVCVGLTDMRCPWPAGKAVGGSSIINGMLYTRGNRKDYDDWAAAGNIGWSYDEILPYMLKSEDIQIPQLTLSPYHANEGNLTIEYAPYTTKLIDYFIEAGKELGFDEIDYNGESHIGFAQIQNTMRAGRRVSSVSAFLSPIKDRPNFHISQTATVTKVIINPEDKRATGVEFIKNGRTRRVSATKEVILSAGTFGSPQILMLSGIGPQEHLQELGIDVIQDLRVGDNLQEHLTMAGLIFLINETISLDVLSAIRSMPKHFLNWYRTGQGPMSTVGAEAFAYVKSERKSDVDIPGIPDIELILVSAPGYASDGGTILRRGMGVTDEIYNAVYRQVEGLPGYTIWPMPLYPKSRGTVRLYDRNPLRLPKITHNFLTEPDDVNVLVDGLQWAIRLSQTNSFQKIGSRLHDTPLPACASITFASDEYWECAVRQLTNQLHHQCGTCKMAPPTDPTAVVDPRLRVYGILNLRVVDASIMPTIVGAHIQAASFMIGEKASDMIKEDWNLF